MSLALRVLDQKDASGWEYPGIPVARRDLEVAGKTDEELSAWGWMKITLPAGWQMEEDQALGCRWRRDVEWSSWRCVVHRREPILDIVKMGLSFLVAVETEECRRGCPAVYGRTPSLAVAREPSL